MNKTKQLEQRIKELERIAEQKQMHIDYYEKMIDLAKEHYDIDIKKDLSSQLSSGKSSSDTKPDLK